MFNPDDIVITLDALNFRTEQVSAEAFQDGNVFGITPTYARFAKATFRIGHLDWLEEFNLPIDVELGPEGEAGAAGLALEKLVHFTHALAKAAADKL